MNDDWKKRLTEDLEPLLRAKDPGPHISVYHDMPCAIFQYPETEEFALRRELELLKTRLESAGKTVTVISLAECMAEALERQDLGPDILAEAEAAVGVQAAVDTVHQALSELEPLDGVVIEKIPRGDPTRDVVFLVRTGALFPSYSTSSMLEHFKGKVSVPTILFYPGRRDGAGLCFMGVQPPQHNAYRAKIF